MARFKGEARSRGTPVQARGLARGLCHALIACAALAACDPLRTPVDLFHDLQGGEIAAERPPPPGAGAPYPHIGTVPPKPLLPDAAARNALRNQLAAERDTVELTAAATPIAKVIPSAPAAADAASRPAADAPSRPAADAAAGAAPESAISATIPAADRPPQAATAPPPPPPRDAALQSVGDPIATPNLPLVPEAPPAPPQLGLVPPPTGVAPPAPPVHAPPPDGSRIFFAPNDAALAPSQRQSLGEIAGRRHTNPVLITGLGEAQSDTPEGQADAIKLGLKRARAVAQGLVAKNVPPGDIRLAASPYGRGAVVTLLDSAPAPSPSPSPSPSPGPTATTPPPAETLTPGAPHIQIPSEALP